METCSKCFIAKQKCHSMNIQPFIGAAAEVISRERRGKLHCSPRPWELKAKETVFHPVLWHCAPAGS